MGTTVRAVLDRKGGDVVSIERDGTVIDAIRRMVARKVGSVLVTDGPEICGIFTERDYMKRIVLQGRHSSSTMVGDVMTDELHFAGLDDTIEDCMSTMTRRRCRHLPVTSHRRLVGLVSIGDCVAHYLDELRAENDLLYDYLRGSWPPSA